MGDIYFDMEYMCKFVDTQYQIFTQEMIDRALEGGRDIKLLEFDCETIIESTYRSAIDDDVEMFSFD